MVSTWSMVSEDTMATLLCQAGDPDYLKVVLLQEIFTIRDSPFVPKETQGMHFERCV